MRVRTLVPLLALGFLAAYAPIAAHAENDATDISPVEADADAKDNDGPTYLRPELEGATTKLSEGQRQFLRRASFSPGYGRLGEQEYFVFRFAYNPNSWLGWEVGLGHNPAHSVHGVLHNLSAVLRYPLPRRIQPYARS